MARIRLQRVAQQMKEVISKVVAHELKDPRAGFITIAGVDVASDLRTARIRFSVLGSPAEKRTAQRALDSARGYIQGRAGQQVVLKFTPIISFHLDESAEREIAMTRQIDQTVQADDRNRVARTIRARIAAGSISDEVAGEIERVAGSEDFIEEIAALLTDLMNIDTTARADIDATRTGERNCLERIERAFSEAWGDDVSLEYHPIDPDIETDELYTPTAYCPGADAGTVYEGRANLTATLLHEDIPEPPEEPVPAEEEETEEKDEESEEDGQEPVVLRSLRLALNAHVDTIAPYIPPSRDGDVILGRGACDDKGPAVMIVAALELLRRLRQTHNVRLRNDVCAQFVVDEEAGGNGTLSLALQDPFTFDGVVVCECTDLKVHTANRGAVWYRIELRALPDRAAEHAAYVILELEKEGRAIKDESDHPLFPHRPVPSNPGIVGPFGTAPCTVNDRIDIDLQPGDVPMGEIDQAVERGLAQYCETHGDKTASADGPADGPAAIESHYSLDRVDDASLRLTVHGRAGHMGSLEDCDSAAIKAAYIVRELSQVRASGHDLQIRLAGHDTDTLVLEGAQGFLPTHRLHAIKKRLAAAVSHGEEEFHTQAGLNRGPVAEVSFDRLQNDAFARAFDCELGAYATESCRQAGIALPPPRGWEASCDARLFADLFRDRDVIVFGPGHLQDAHGEGEQVRLRDIAAGAKMLTYLLLDAAGFAT
jgi:ribosome-binding factor A